LSNLEFLLIQQALYKFSVKIGEYSSLCFILSNLLMMLRMIHWYLLARLLSWSLIDFYNRLY